VDAIATPFVQGQLRKKYLRFTIESECGHCGKPLTIDIDSDLNYSIQEQDAEPLIFVPMVDFDKLQDPSIIDAF
jgi:hypothetical protein